MECISSDLYLISRGQAALQESSGASDGASTLEDLLQQVPDRRGEEDRRLVDHRRAPHRLLHGEAWLGLGLGLGFGFGFGLELGLGLGLRLRLGMGLPVIASIATRPCHIWRGLGWGSVENEAWAWVRAGS